MSGKHEDIASKLIDKGYRLTPQRMMVLEAISHSTDHISADEIYSKVVKKYPHVNISTVYRNLELLKHLGLVVETDMGGGRVRYHPADRGRHHHLVCQNCDRVIDLNESVLLPLKTTLRKEYNFDADLSHLAIFGRCGECQK